MEDYFIKYELFPLYLGTSERSRRAKSWSGGCGDVWSSSSGASGRLSGGVGYRITETWHECRQAETTEGLNLEASFCSCMFLFVRVIKALPLNIIVFTGSINKARWKAAHVYEGTEWTGSVAWGNVWNHRSIVTSQWRRRKGKGTTDKHQGREESQETSNLSLRFKWIL